MIESDQSDKEVEIKMPLEVSNDDINDNEPGQKRSRTDTSEDESLHLPSKKIRISVNETIADKHEDKHISEANGIREDVKEDTKDVNIEDKENMEDKLTLKEDTDQVVEETDDAKSETKDKEASINNDSAIKEENEPKTPKSESEAKKEVMNYICFKCN